MFVTLVLRSLDSSLAIGTEEVTLKNLIRFMEIFDEMSFPQLLKHCRKDLIDICLCYQFEFYSDILKFLSKCSNMTLSLRTNHEKVHINNILAAHKYNFPN